MEGSIFKGMGDYVYVPLKGNSVCPMFESSESAWDYARHFSDIKYVVEKPRLSEDRLVGVFSTVALYQETLDARIAAGESIESVLKDYKEYLEGVVTGGRMTKVESGRIFLQYKKESEPKVHIDEDVIREVAAYERAMNAPAVYRTTLCGAYAFAKYLDSMRIPYDFNEGLSPLDAVVTIASEYNSEDVKHAFACIQK